MLIMVSKQSQQYHGGVFIIMYCSSEIKMGLLIDVEKYTPHFLWVIAKVGHQINSGLSGSI